MHLFDTFHRPEAEHFRPSFPGGITFCFFAHKKSSVTPMGGRIGPKIGVGELLSLGAHLTHFWGHFVLEPFLPSYSATAFN